MKKFKFLLMLFLLFSICAYSQTDDKHWKKKYLNIGFDKRIPLYLKAIMEPHSLLEEHFIYTKIPLEVFCVLD